MTWRTTGVLGRNLRTTRDRAARRRIAVSTGCSFPDECLGARGRDRPAGISRAIDHHRASSSTSSGAGNQGADRSRTAGDRPNRRRASARSRHRDDAATRGARPTRRPPETEAQRIDRSRGLIKTAWTLRTGRRAHPVADLPDAPPRSLRGLPPRAACSPGAARPRPERQDTFTVWLRVFERAAQVPIPYRVVQETRIGPSFAAYLGGDLIDDYLGQPGSASSAWGDQSPRSDASRGPA